MRDIRSRPGTIARTVRVPEDVDLRVQCAAARREGGNYSRALLIALRAGLDQLRRHDSGKESEQ